MCVCRDSKPLGQIKSKLWLQCCQEPGAYERHFVVLISSWRYFGILVEYMIAVIVCCLCTNNELMSFHTQKHSKASEPAGKWQASCHRRKLHWKLYYIVHNQYTTIIDHDTKCIFAVLVNIILLSN